MDMIIQIILLPFIAPIYLYMIYLEKKYEKEKEERRRRKPKNNIYTEEKLSLNELRAKKKYYDFKEN